MAGGITTYSLTTGIDANEMIVKYLTDDPLGLLDKALGFPPAQLSCLPGGTGDGNAIWTAVQATATPQTDSSVQTGSQHNAADLIGLDPISSTAGFTEVDITFRPFGPIDGMSGSNTYAAVEENSEISTQALSIVTAFMGQKNGLWWESGEQASNIQQAVKLIPKLSILQKRVFLKAPPTNEMLNLVGTINNDDYQIMVQGQGNFVSFKKDQLLLVGLPWKRIGRWDGDWMFSVDVQIAANMNLDTDGTVLGWNYFLNVQVFPSKWDKLLIGKDGDPIFKETDFSKLSDLK